LNDLAVLDEMDGRTADALDLFRRGAQQGHPLAMYNLALHYRDGVGLLRDDSQASEWFARAAGAGLVSAMVEYGRMLNRGSGQADSRPNRRRAIEWLQRAADSGSLRAMYYLGRIYELGQGHDVKLALLWYGRAAEAGYSDAQVHVAQIMEKGDDLPNPQPEIAERYWRLAANHGDPFAQVQFADKLRSGLLMVKEEYGQGEVVTMLTRAMSQGSAHAAVALAQIYRKGELGEDKNPVKAMEYAYHAIDLSVLADPTTLDGDPYYEFSAGHLLAEMAKSGEAVDALGRPLLTPEEIDRLQRYYGTVDPATKQVKVRAFKMPVFCDADQEWYVPVQIRVWDWGRSEAPTEFQIRYYERLDGCTYNTYLRATLIDIYSQAKKSKVAFADLLAQRIQTLEGQRQSGKSK
jgi:TPR repeat protein